VNPDEDAILRALLSLPAESLMRVLGQIPKNQLQKALKHDAAVGPVSDARNPPAPMSHDSAPPTEDPRRNARRQRVLRGAKIIYNNRLSVAEAQVRDLSEKGCRIRVSAASLLPTTFDIRITGIDGERRCEVRWRKGTELGVLFLD
jgi:hypothetical protein